MSEKWETVGKAKSAGGGSKTKMNGAKNGKKPESKVTYSMEDVLPASSVQNMYGAFNPSPASPKKEKKESNGTAAVKEKPKETKTEPKPKLPSTLSQAVKDKLRVDDLKSLLEESQTKFPDSPLLWLRDVATYLNQKLVVSPSPAEPVGLLSGEPQSVLTANIRKVINCQLLQKCSESMKETFFETCVANTAHDLAKGSNVVGWKILTQLLAESQPSLVTAHISRYIELRNSYQNRPAIGIAILWSVGQAGMKSLHSGIKVWLEIMLPVISFKHYQKFIVSYLAELLEVHHVTEYTQMNKPVVDIANFLTIQDSVFIVSSQMNKEHSKTLRDQYPALRAICVAGCKNHELFPELLSRLSTVSMPDQVKDTLELLCQCLVTNSEVALVHWHKLYISHLPQSAQLIQFIDSNWPNYKPALDVPDFHNSLEAFQDYNSSVINKDGLELATIGCQSLSTKVRRGGMSWFPWKTLSFLLLFSTAAIISADIEAAGGKFSTSNMGQFLSDIGQYDRVTLVSQMVTDNYKGGREWADKTIPLYLDQVQPYYLLAQDKAADGKELVVLAYKKVAVMTKAGVNKLEESLPGTREKLDHFGDSTLTFSKEVLAKAQLLASNAQRVSLEIVNGKVDWCCLKEGALNQLEFVQRQAVSAYDFVMGYINQMKGK